MPYHPTYRTGAQNPGTTGTTTTQTVASLNIPSFVPYEGNSSATINIVEFGDYQCPFCEQFFSNTESQVMQNYVDNGKAKFYFLDFAFLGPDSTTLAEGAWCANDQNLYYQYHDYIYAHQQQENSGWANVTQVEALAANIPGVNAQQFNSCLESGKYQSRVQSNTQLGQNTGVTGTPSFFIGNDKIGYQMITGAYPYSTFQSTLDSQLAKV